MDLLVFVEPDRAVLVESRLIVGMGVVPTSRVTREGVGVDINCGVSALLSSVLPSQPLVRMVLTKKTT